jgi:hypothetical protein
MCHEDTTCYVRALQTFDGPAAGTRRRVPRQSLRLRWRDHVRPILVFTLSRNAHRGTGPAPVPGEGGERPLVRLDEAVYDDEAAAEEAQKAAAARRRQREVAEERERARAHEAEVVDAHRRWGQV